MTTLGNGSFGLPHHWVNGNLSWFPVLRVVVDEEGIVVLINFFRLFMSVRISSWLKGPKSDSSAGGYRPHDGRRRPDHVSAPLLLSSCSGFYFCLSVNVLGSEQCWLRQRLMPLPAAPFHRSRKALVAGKGKWAAPQHLPRKDEEGEAVRSKQFLNKREVSGKNSAEEQRRNGWIVWILPV